MSFPDNLEVGGVKTEMGCSPTNQTTHKMGKHSFLNLGLFGVREHGVFLQLCMETPPAVLICIWGGEASTFLGQYME